jgi:hypothetical protein
MGFRVGYWNYQKMNGSIFHLMGQSDSDFSFAPQRFLKFRLVDIDFAHISCRSKLPQSLIMKLAEGRGEENLCISVGNAISFPGND